MTYKINFKKGGLGKYQMKGQDIDVFISNDYKSKYKDEKYVIHSALFIVMEKLNLALHNDDVEVKMEDWLDEVIAKRIIEGELKNVENINYL